MIQQNLVPYVREQLAKGYKIEGIRRAILQQAYSQSDVEDTINFITQQENPSGAPARPPAPMNSTLQEEEVEFPPFAAQKKSSRGATARTMGSAKVGQDGFPSVAMQNRPPMGNPPAPPKRMSFVQKIEEIVFHPNQFFEDVRGEGFREPFVFNLIFTGILFAITTLIGFAITAVTAGLFAAMISFIFTLIITVFQFVFVICLTLLGVAITHLCAKLLKGQGSFTETFKAAVYSSVPAGLAGIVLLIIFGVILVSIGGTGNLPALFATLFLGLIFFALIAIAVALWTFIIYLRGLGKLHGRSAWWALGVVALQTAVFLIIFLVFALIIGALIYGLVMSVISSAPLAAGGVAQSTLGNPLAKPTTIATCMLPEPFSCEDVSWSGNGVMLTMSARTTPEIIDKIEVTGPGITEPCVYTGYDHEPASMSIVSFTCKTTSTKKEDYALAITYRTENATPSQTVIGSLTAKPN